MASEIKTNQLIEIKTSRVQYGGAMEKTIIVDGIPIASVSWINGTPYLAGKIIQPEEREKYLLDVERISMLSVKQIKDS